MTTTPLGQALAAATTYAGNLQAAYDELRAEYDAHMATHQPTAEPERDVTLWHFGWSNGNGKAVQLAAHPKGLATHVCWGMAQSAQAGTGLLRDVPVDGYTSRAAAKADVDRATAAGMIVAVGVGGSGDGGIKVRTDTQADQLVASVLRMRDSLGINGVSLDLEAEPAEQWSQAAMLRAIRKLHDAGLWVDLCFGLWGTRTAAWTALAVAGGDAVDQVSTMLYDFPEAADQRIVGVTVDKLRVLNERGVPLSKACMLYAARPTWSYPNSTPTAALVVMAVRAGETAYGAKGYAGAYGWWDDKQLASRSWAMALDAAAELQ